MNSKQLKILAVCSMVFDHITLIFPLWELFAPLSDGLQAAGWPGLSTWVLEDLTYALQYIGRLAAPIFLFGIAQGFTYTRSVGRYLRRLLTAAMAAQIPYVLFFQAENRLWGVSGDWREVYGNILFTMALGLAALALCERLRRAGRPVWAAAAALAAMALSYVLPIEGGKGHILIIFVFYYTRHLPRWQRALLFLPAAALARLNLVLWVLEDSLVLRTCLLNVLGSYLGMLATLCGSGGSVHQSKAFSRFFYVFYPAHFAVLALIGYLRPVF